MHLMLANTASLHRCGSSLGKPHRLGRLRV